MTCDSLPSYIGVCGPDSRSDDGQTIKRPFAFHFRKPRSITTSIRAVSSLDRRGVPVDQVQVQPDQERVVLGEPPVSASVSVGDLGPQPTLGQVRQHRRVPFPGDQRLEHRPARRHR